MTNGPHRYDVRSPDGDEGGPTAPLLLTLAAVGLGGGWTAAFCALLAAALASAGVVIERWLFFAEAKHTVTLYYGALVA